MGQSCLCVTATATNVIPVHIQTTADVHNRQEANLTLATVPEASVERDFTSKKGTHQRIRIRQNDPSMILDGSSRDSMPGSPQAHGHAHGHAHTYVQECTNSANTIVAHPPSNLPSPPIPPVLCDDTNVLSADPIVGTALNILEQMQSPKISSRLLPLSSNSTEVKVSVDTFTKSMSIAAVQSSPLSLSNKGDSIEQTRPESTRSEAPSVSASTTEDTTEFSQRTHMNMCETTSSTITASEVSTPDVHMTPNTKSMNPRTTRHDTIKRPLTAHNRFKKSNRYTVPIRHGLSTDKAPLFASLYDARLMRPPPLILPSHDSAESLKESIRIESINSQNPRYGYPYPNPHPSIGKIVEHIGISLPSSPPPLPLPAME